MNVAAGDRGPAVDCLDPLQRVAEDQIALAVGENVTPTPARTPQQIEHRERRWVAGQLLADHPLARLHARDRKVGVFVNDDLGSGVRALSLKGPSNWSLSPRHWARSRIGPAVRL